MSQKIDQGNVTQVVLPITQNGKQIIEISYRRTKDYKRKEVEKIVKNFRERLVANQKVNGYLQVAVYYDDLGWRSQGKTNIRDGDPSIFSLIDYADNFKTQYNDNSFQGINIYFYKEGSTSGRTSKKGDCFYRSLRQVIPPEYLPFANDATLKAYFCLQKADGIDISLLPKIEKLIPKYAINVVGDHMYISTKDTPFKVYLRLENGHYTVDEKKTIIGKVKGVFNEERIPCIYKHEGNQVKCHYYSEDGYKYETIQRKDFNNMMNNPQGNKFRKQAPHPFNFIPNHSNETPKEQLDDFIKDADDLKEATDGLINLYKTGHFKKSALALFYSLNKGLEAENIKEHEAHWINMCNTGALIWAVPYEGEGHLYDYVSRYPSIMRHKTFRFPIKAGTFKKIINLDTIASGIYRVKIANVNPHLFRINKFHYYTATDIYRAKSLNANIELIIDNQPNFLHYAPETMVSGDKIFSQYIDLVYKLKENKIRGSKKMLNMLWGALCQKDITRKMIKKDLCYDFTDEIDSIRPETDTHFYISTIKKQNQFCTPYARLGPFLLSKGREILSKLMEPYINDIVRVHTDSMLTTRKLDIPTDTTLGSLKYEGYYPNCEVVNSQTVKGDFVKV